MRPASRQHSSSRSLVDCVVRLLHPCSQSKHRRDFPPPDKTSSLCAGFLPLITAESVGQRQFRTSLVTGTRYQSSSRNSFGRAAFHSAPRSAISSASTEYSTTCVPRGQEG